VHPNDHAGRALKRVLALMDARYADRLDLGTLCGEAHFSRYHFIRTFRSRFFETPHQYLIRKRIDRARELLAHVHGLPSCPFQKVPVLAGFFEVRPLQRRKT